MAFYKHFFSFKHTKSEYESALSQGADAFSGTHVLLLDYDLSHVFHV